MATRDQFATYMAVNYGYGQAQEPEPDPEAQERKNSTREQFAEFMDAREAKPDKRAQALDNYSRAISDLKEAYSALLETEPAEPGSTAQVPQSIESVPDAGGLTIENAPRIPDPIGELQAMLDGSLAFNPFRSPEGWISL